jgi:RNA polymerase sigma-70 factor (ECF subfamily)
MKQPAPDYEDAEAFHRLYEETNLSVFRYTCGLLGGPGAEADDLAAETYFRAWNARRSFHGDGKAALGWLLRIAHNLVIDAYRREKTRGESQDIEELAIPSLEPGPEQQALQQEQLQVLWSLVKKLPEDQREILTLRYVLGWPVKEIAAHLGILENTASQTIHRTLSRLRADWYQND